MLQDTQELLHNIEMELLFDSHGVDTESNAKYAQEVKKLLDSIKSVHCIFIHSKEHSQWAKGAAFQWNDTLTTLAPDVTISSSDVLVTGTDEEILKTLTDFHDFYQSEEADRTFIVTPGWWESKAVLRANKYGVLPYKQLFCLSGVPSPLLSAVIGQPQEEYLLGGVYNMLMPSEHYINSIMGVRPDTKKVCILYDPETADTVLRMNMAVQILELKAVFAEKNIEVVLHHWNSVNIYVQELRKATLDVDSIITLHEPAAAVHHKQLIELCNEWDIFVCASELDSVAGGAAIGGGVYGATFGIPLAQLMFEYLFEPVQKLEHSMGWRLHRIPQQSAMRFNESAFEDQGLLLTEDRLELLRMKSAFDSNCVEL
jgi:hypothetical protein